MGYDRRPWCVGVARSGGRGVVFEIEGRNKDTGRRVKVRVEAASAVEALRRASRHGVIELGTPVEVPEERGLGERGETAASDGAGSEEARGAASSEGVREEGEVGAAAGVGEAGSNAGAERGTRRRGWRRKKWEEEPAKEIPEELLELMLPVVRRGKKRRRFLAVCGEGIVVGRAARGKDDPTGSTSAIESLVGGGNGRLRGFRYEEIEGISVAPVDQSLFARLEVRAKGQVWRGIVPTGPESLAIQAIRQCSGGEVEKRSLRASTERLVVRCFLGLFAAAAAVMLLWAFGNAALRLLRYGKIDGEEVAIVTGLFGCLAAVFGVLLWLKWPARPERPRRIRARQARARPWTRVMEGLRTVRAGLVLRLAGVAALVGAYVASEPLGNWFVRSVSEVGNPLSGIVTRVGWIVLTAPAIVLVRTGYVLSQRSASEVLRRDSRKPVLFLRSFGDDLRHTFSEESRTARMCGLVTPREMMRGGSAIGRHIKNAMRWESVIRLPLRTIALALGRGSDTAEEQLVRALEPLGPMIAVGNPKEAFPTPGAARLYLGHAEWQERVTEMIREAALVIVQPAETEGVWWEMGAAMRHQSPDRVVVCLAALADEDVRDVALARLGRMLGMRLGDQFREAAFIAFDAEWRPRPVERVEFNPFHWPWRGTSVDVWKTLAPVVERIEPGRQVGRVERARAGRAARLSAGWTYGIAPIVLIFGLAFAPLLAGLWAPTVTGRMIVRHGPGYRLEVDEAWGRGERKTGDVPGEGYSLGRGKVLSITATPRSDRATLVPWSRQDAEGVALRVIGGAERVRSMSSMERREIGGWPWVCATAVVEGEGVQGRVDIAVLEASTRRFVVVCAQAVGVETGAAGKRVGWDEAMFASVRKGLKTFSATESVFSPNSEGRLAWEALPRRGQRYEMRAAKGWRDGEPNDARADRTLRNERGATLSIYRIAGGGVEDPVAELLAKRERLSDAYGGAPVEPVEGGWIKMDGETCESYRLVIAPPGMGRELIGVVGRSFENGIVVNGVLLMTEEDEAVMEETWRDVRAMMSSIEFK